ncbi:Cysteine-rich CPCC [Hymenobacter psychrotolerans DSM 18569]|uniref:Cysteine-rich CPCC n=2 Tax=Hymenobacter psychrotolerans TaxID=344998 RepID=A0A1M6T064_9BACT|nr:Cysteine-rich CPCC [Hymenobacter psychrotolerans DSM 18569]
MYAANRFGNYQCPCCRYFTLSEGDAGSYDICHVCFWEDDGLQFQDPDYVGGANNSLSLNEARRNFQQFGVCKEEFRRYVRAPKPDEMPDQQ